MRPPAGKICQAALEEGGVAFEAKVLECPDADDAVDRLVEFLPALQAELDARLADRAAAGLRVLIAR